MTKSINAVISIYLICAIVLLFFDHQSNFMGFIVESNVQLNKKHGNHLYWQDNVQSMNLHNLKTLRVLRNTQK